MRNTLALILALFLSLTAWAGPDVGNGGGIFYPGDGSQPIMLDLALSGNSYNDVKEEGDSLLAMQRLEYRLKKLESLHKHKTVLPTVLLKALMSLNVRFVTDVLPTTYEQEGVDVSNLPPGEIKGFAIYDRDFGGAVININHWNATGMVSREAVLLKETLRQVQIQYGLLVDRNKIYLAVPELLQENPDNIDYKKIVSGLILFQDLDRNTPRDEYVE